MLLAPPPPGPSTCAVCLTPLFGQPPQGRVGRGLCHRCRAQPRAADSVLAISYSPHDGALHAMLRDYKATGRAAARLRVALSAILWRFLAAHERCLAAAAGAAVDAEGAAFDAEGAAVDAEGAAFDAEGAAVDAEGAAVDAGGAAFDAVCIVPSTRRRLALRHPLMCVLAALDPVVGRLDCKLLEPASAARARVFDPRHFRVARSLRCQSVLLIDDTWTTGASAQSAAAALKLAGAGSVGVLVIGRHVREGYGDNRVWLSMLERGFDWNRCARCEQAVRCRGASPRALAVREKDGSADASGGSRIRVERAET